MVKFIHWERIPEFPFSKIVEEFEVYIILDDTWEDVKKILTEHNFDMQPHFNGSFLAFPFGVSAEDASEGWEGWEV